MFHVDLEVRKASFLIKRMGCFVRFNLRCNSFLTSRTGDFTVDIEVAQKKEIHEIYTGEECRLLLHVVF